MRARRCPGCGERFYAAPGKPECQNCSGDHDPSAQAQEDAANISMINSARVAGRRQTVNLRDLQEAQKAQNEAAQVSRGKKANA